MLSFMLAVFVTTNNSIVNKQLNDKERVAAALENPSLVEVLETCLQGAGR